MARAASVGSHSIIHSRGFNKFELGTGEETFPTYQPRGTGFESSSGATVFGEVRVSKELLEGNLPGQTTIFFRAGHLRVPHSLPEALQRCGYEFDSSFTADDVLTNFPYHLPLDLGFEEDRGLYEFPVTFEDEAPPPLPQRIDQALAVIRANAENGAMNVLLIHPNETGSKLAAEERLRRLPGDVAVAEMLTLAQFWRARDRLRWTTAVSRAEVLVAVRSAEAVHGLTLDFDRQIGRVDEGITLLGDHHRIVLPELRENQQVVIHVHYAGESLLETPSMRRLFASVMSA